MGDRCGFRSRVCAPAGKDAAASMEGVSKTRYKRGQMKRLLL